MYNIIYNKKNNNKKNSDNVRVVQYAVFIFEISYI